MLFRSPYRLPLPAADWSYFSLRLASEANAACVLLLSCTDVPGIEPPAARLLRLRLPAQGVPLSDAMVQPIWSKEDHADARWISDIFDLSPDGARLLVVGRNLDGNTDADSAFLLDLVTGRFEHVTP